ncbi:MAG: redox-regulated ATPase YchF [Candidatus Krumholzibacteria bacterium]|nr:redox-regulated ATPase YchF [Candidatus Krumholzibacteria bacterium]
MKLALMGISNSGRTTIFNGLTGQDAATACYAGAETKPNVAVVKVPDHRIDQLACVFKPKKITYATVEYMDYLGLTKGDAEQNGKVIDFLKNADALVYVLRGFDDEHVAHPLGGVDPVRDFDTLETELLIFDLDLTEKRLLHMEEAARRGKPPHKDERSAVLACKETLEKGMPLRCMEFDETQKLALKHLTFISSLPVMAVINVAECDLKSERSSAWQEAIRERTGRFTLDPMTPIVLSGKSEMEIARLPREEAAEFLKDLGVDVSARERMIKESYQMLGLISFLTVGEDEVRAWTIRNGTEARTAAGKIHTDLERGFIRAEVVSYDDFIGVGSLAAARAKGLLRLEGKTYIVRDGDIIDFRFSV